MKPTLNPGNAQYLLLSEMLKQLPGHLYEGHRHPAVVLDLATGPTTRVWGWWTSGAGGQHPSLPCLLWAGELGWSATIVEPDLLDSEGYERAFWSHRIKLLDLALANALGPYPCIEQLELHVAAEESFGADSRAPEVKAAMMWGILQLEVAQARRQDQRTGGGSVLRPSIGTRGTVDEELITHVLSPTFAKAGADHVEPGEGGLAALLKAAMTESSRESSRERRRHVWSLPAWKPPIPGAQRLHHVRGFEPGQTA